MYNLSLFPVLAEDLRVGISCDSTVVSVDGQPEAGWLFVETLLDEDHCAVVATRYNNNNNNNNDDRTSSQRKSRLPGAGFQSLSVEQLLDDFHSENVEGQELEWNEFNVKPCKNW